MKFLVVVAPPSIYHGCSTRKTFLEEKFTGKKQDCFVSLNMRNCGQRNVRKHREIEDIDERVTLNMNEILKISEKFDNLDKMETTSSESKVKIAPTTVSHVHRQKKILLLTCEIFLPERLLNGATMINRRWGNN